jgi:hypothetical protein
VSGLHPLEAAQRLLEAGLSVIPLLPVAGMRPAISEHGLYQQRFPSLAELKDWFRGGQLGVGIVCGRISCGLEVLAFADAEAFQVWRNRLEQQAPGLRERLTAVMTADNAWQLYYRCPDSGCSQILAECIVTHPTARKPMRKTLISVHGETAYLPAPGLMLGCYAGGRSYEHKAGPSLLQLSTLTPAERDLLFAVAHSLDTTGRADSREVSRPPEPSDPAPPLALPQPAPLQPEADSSKGPATPSRRSKAEPALLTWSDPIQASEPPAAAFPLEVLPPALANYAQALAQTIPCPVDLPAVLSLAAAATAIGSVRQIHIKSSWQESCRLWLACVCDQSARTSMAFRLALGPLVQRHRQARRPCQPIEPVPWAHVLTDNLTRQAVLGCLADNDRSLLVARQEIGGWLRRLNDALGTNDAERQLWLGLASGEALLLERPRQEALWVERPHVSVAGTLTPAMLILLHDEHSREDGLLHRFLFAWPDSVQDEWQEAEPPAAVVQEYEDLLNRLFALQPEQDGAGQPQPRTLHFTDAAHASFVAFVQRLVSDRRDPEFAENLRGPWQEAQRYAARLALLLQVCRQQPGQPEPAAVDEAAVDGAVRLLDYFLSHAARVYSCLQPRTLTLAEQDIQRVVAWIRRHRDRIEWTGRGTDKEQRKAVPYFTWHEILSDLRKTFCPRPEALTRALQALKLRGWIQELPPVPKAGRQCHPRFAVNPAVHHVLSTYSPSTEEEPRAHNI